MPPTSPDPGPDPIVAEVASGYAFDGPALELLAAKLEAGTAAARKESAPDGGGIGYPRRGARKRPAPHERSGDSVEDIMTSPMARDLMRTAAREIVRGVFRVGRRR
jgi:hypothetical protein